MAEINTGTYFVGIRFPTSEKSYYFSTDVTDLEIGDLVVVDTVNGSEIATVSTPVMDQSQYRSELKLKPLLRKADDVDITNHEINLRNAKRALAIAQKEIERLGLAMNLVSAYYTLDGSKITINYTSTEKRVDFRELLRVLAPQLGARLELFQMAARDKAKYIGGIGICGLPLCCSTFLTQFDGISIHMAKNQMLAINTAKLSGHCGKYLCCLGYEDDLYTQEKRKYPSFGTIVHTPDGDYTVDAMNIISQTVRMVNRDRSDYKTYPLEDVKAMIEGRYRKKEEPTKIKEEELPDFNIPGANQGRDASYGGMNPSKYDKGNYSHVAADDNNESRNSKRNKNRHDHDHGRNGQRQDKEQNQHQKEQKDAQNRQNNERQKQKKNRHEDRHQKNGGQQNNQQPKAQDTSSRPQEGKKNNHRRFHRHGPRKEGGNKE